MATDYELNFLSIVERELKSRAKNAIANKIIKEKMRELEREVAAMVWAEVDKISFERIEHHMNPHEFRNEIVVYVNDREVGKV